MSKVIEKRIRTRSFPFEEFCACGLASWCFRHFGGMIRLLRIFFSYWTLECESRSNEKMVAVS